MTEFQRDGSGSQKHQGLRKLNDQQQLPKISREVVRLSVTSPLFVRHVDTCLDDVSQLFDGQFDGEHSRRSRRTMAQTLLGQPGFVQGLTTLLHRIFRHPRLCVKCLSILISIFLHCEGSDPWSAEADAVKRRFGSRLVTVMVEILSWLTTVTENTISEVEFQERFVTRIPKKLRGNNDALRHIFSFHYSGFAHNTIITRHTMRVLLRLIEHNHDNMKDFASIPKSCENLVLVCQRHRYCTSLFDDGLQVIFNCARNLTAKRIILTPYTCQVILQSLLSPELDFSLIKVRVGLPILHYYLPIDPPAPPSSQRFHELCQMGLLTAVIRAWTTSVYLGYIAALRDCCDSILYLMNWTDGVKPHILRGWLDEGLCEALVAADVAYPRHKSMYLSITRFIYENADTESCRIVDDRFRQLCSPDDTSFRSVAIMVGTEAMDIAQG